MFFDAQSKYFCLLDGSSRWDATAEAIFDDLFHPNVKILGNQKSFTFNEWKAWYQQSIEDGLVLDMEKVVRTGAQSIAYTLLVHNHDGTVLSHTAEAHFEDGKLIKTEPTDKAVYDIMTNPKPKRQAVCIL